VIKAESLWSNFGRHVDTRRQWAHGDKGTTENGKIVLTL
jgi:hypothetical protein